MKAAWQSQSSSNLNRRSLSLSLLGLMTLLYQRAYLHTEHFDLRCEVVAIVFDTVDAVLVVLY